MLPDTLTVTYPCSSPGCLIDGCEVAAKTRGLCAYHYAQAKHYGIVDKVGAPKAPTLADTHGSEVMAMWDSGMTMYRIAKETGISNPTVREILVKMGVKDPARKRV